MPTVKKPMKKAQLGKSLPAKDSMKIYANRYDSLSATGAKKLTSDKKGATKDLKAAGEARTNENRIAKKLYNTTPSNKMGGKVKKAQEGRKMLQSISVTDQAGNKSKDMFGLGNAKIKTKSMDKNYVSKAKTDASGNVTSMKSRRTVKGLLTGAPKVKDNLKKGGKISKKK